MIESGRQIASALGGEMKRQSIGLDDVVDLLQEPITNVVCWLTNADSMPLGALAQVASLLGILPSSLV